MTVSVKYYYAHRLWELLGIGKLQQTFECSVQWWYSTVVVQHSGGTVQWWYSTVVVQYGGGTAQWWYSTLVH